MNHRKKYDSLMWDIPIYDEKNKDLADWLLNIEKVTLLKNNKEYELAMAKSTGSPYKMLKRIGWPEVGMKLGKR